MSDSASELATRLLADAKAREYVAKQLVRGDLACDFTQRQLRESQFLGK
jgi:hypothetical protein